MAKRSWDIINNPKTKRWFLQIPEGLESDLYPSLQEIKDSARSKGIDPTFLQSDPSLEKNLKKALEAVGEEYSFPVVIDPTFDVRLIISPDKVSAYLYIRKAADKGNQLDIKLVSTLINNSRLKGMDAQKIKEGINEFRTSPAMELIDFLIAEGTHPGRGKNRELISQFDWVSTEETIAIREKLSLYLKQDKLSENIRFAHVIKDAFIYEFSPAEQGTPGIDVYGNVIPGLPGNDPFFQIIENINVSKTGLKAEKTGLLLVDEKEDRSILRLIPCFNGIATPVITPDKMTASLILESEEGAGTPLTVEMALKALGEKGIKGQFDTALIEKTIQEVRSSKTSKEIIIVQGTKAVKPGAARLTWNIHFLSEPAAVDITTGETILTIEKIPAGCDGYDVFGTILAASTAQSDIIPEHDESIILETGNLSQIFIAGKSGELRLINNRLIIKDTKELTCDVDDKTGNISFPGNLVLTGTVRSGRSIKATGSLTVNGNAEASLVSSETSVTMNGGIRGSGKGTVWAKQTMQLQFAENAHLLAGQDISISNYCFQCTVKTNGMHLMKGNPAILLGGNIRASKGVEVFELGSEKTMRTSISFGQNYLVSDQIEVCEKEVKNIHEAIKKIDAEMKQTAANDPAIHELRAKKFGLLKRNEKLTVRIFMLKEQFEAHIISHIKVDNIVYPGVILESHGRYYEVREQKCHVIFIFDQQTGQIVCSPIE